MADELTTGVSDAGGVPASSGNAPASTAPRFTDDSEFIPPGSDKPVKYKDFIGGQYVSKADLTRMRQHDAVQLDRERRTLKEQEAQLTRAAQQLAARLGPQANQPDVLAQLEALPTMDGKTGAAIVRQIAQAIQQRDQAYGLLLNRLNTLEKGYGTLQAGNRTAEVSGLFHAVRTGLGLADNPQIAALIESEYHAHQGWDNVSAPERVEALSHIVKERLDGLMQVFKTQQQQRVDAARTQSPQQRMALTVPRNKGRRPGSETPQEIADALFPMMQGGPNT